MATSGLVITSGAAANAAADDSQGREVTTLQVAQSDLSVERASSSSNVAVTASQGAELTFDRPVVSSTPAPEPEPEPEPVAPQPATQQEEAPVQQEAPAQQAPAQQAPAQQAEQAPAQQAQGGQQAEQAPAQQAQGGQQAEQAPAQQAQGGQQAEQAPAQQAEQAPAQQAEQAPAQQAEQAPAQQAQGGQQAEQAPAQQAEPAAETQPEPEPASAPAGGGSIVSAAYAGVGTPYSWGGTTTAGFDCSGLINWAYNQAGKSVPRTTHGMAASLTSVSSPEPGDIVLANGNGHGGIYVGNGQVISATSSGGVRLHGLHESWHSPSGYYRA
nr:C40 family peptidase [Nesterenkonia lacusekhoensis]